jgi:MerR family mercuric resistance operon transcriptional regulator
MLKTELRIGELAQAAGVPTSTVRYYERAGILEPSGRTAANYRFYS